MSDHYRLCAEALLSTLPSDTSTATGANSARSSIATYLREFEARIRSESARPTPPDLREAEEVLKFVVENGQCGRACEDGDCFHPEMVQKAKRALSALQPQEQKKP